MLYTCTVPVHKCVNTSPGLTVYWSSRQWKTGVLIRLHRSARWSAPLLYAYTSSTAWTYDELDHRCIRTFEIVTLTLCLQVSSANNLCKQFVPRSGPTECRACPGSKLFYTLNVFQKKNPDVNFENKNHEKNLSILIHRVKMQVFRYFVTHAHTLQTVFRKALQFLWQ